MAFVKIPFSDLEFYERLGDGASGSVYKAKWRSKDRIVAVKKLLQHLDSEAEVLNSLRHCNIVKFFGATTVAPNFCIVTEFVENGSLYDFLHKYNEQITYQHILSWAGQIAQGMNYLHFEAPDPVIHRDLKSRNIVIAMDLTAKICDFGSSKFHLHTTILSVVGTYPWMAPEVIKGEPVTTACDVFSYSVVLWELLTREVPFSGLEGHRVAYQVAEREERLMIPSSCPSDFSNLMQHCWKTDPEERLNFKEIIEILDVMNNNETLEEETDTFMQKKSEWKKELESKLKELSIIEKKLTHKQQELDKREQSIKERELALQEHQKVNTSWYVTRGEITMTQEVLGKGGWGEVRVAKFRGSRVGAKCFHDIPSPDNLELFTREVDMAAGIHHINLLQFLGATKEGSLIILYELMHSSLRNLLEKAPLDHPNILRISMDVAAALNYLHLWQPSPIVHRDVSSPNVLLEPSGDNSWKAKLSDYGSANLMQHISTESVAPCNPAYSAPEIHIPDHHSPAMDIYSFGVLLTEMVLCRPPGFTTAEKEQLSLTIRWPLMKHVVIRCIATDRQSRPSIADILQQLEQELYQVQNEESQVELSHVDQPKQELQKSQEENHQLQEDVQQLHAQQENWVVCNSEIFMTQEIVGKGGWGEVKVAKFRGSRVAAKYLYNIIISNYNFKLFTREMELSARIRHPNLLLFMGATKEGSPIILTELMPTSLHKQLEEAPLSRPNILRIGTGVAAALNYLHLWQPYPIIHRDISSSNVLLEPSGNDSWKAKLSYYSSPNLMHQISPRSVAPGSLAYFAPEARFPNHHSPAMDIYSYGVLLTEMVLCSPPGYTDEERQQLSLTIKWPAMKDVVMRCIATDRQSRPSIADILQQFEQMKV